MTYKWVKIDTQIWMAENLNFFDTNDNTSACYGGNENKCKKFGRLYSWDVAVSDACPAGWYLPSNDEWSFLKTFAGDSSGIKLRSKDGWTTTATDAVGPGTDSYSFNALPGGYYNGSGYIEGENNQKQGGYWWSDGRTGQNDAPHWAIYYDSTGLTTGDKPKSNLLSIRCIKR